MVAIHNETSVMTVHRGSMYIRVCLWASMFVLWLEKKLQCLLNKKKTYKVPLTCKLICVPSQVYWKHDRQKPTSPFSVAYSNMQGNNKKEVKLTICISYLALILESSSYSNAKNHKYPIDVRDVNLPQKFLRGMHNIDTGETAQCKSLLNYWVGSRYGCLTCNYCRKSCYDEGWPVYGLCSESISTLV